MPCQLPPLEKLTNSQTLLNPSQLGQEVAATIAYQLGIALVVGETIIPLAPFIWAALGIEEILGLFGGGRPKFEDTDAVINAYKESAFWPLHALAADLQIAEKNGAPISDSNPQVQATFSKWKQGTIESLQQLAGHTPGPSGFGYWQLQQLINTSWVYSKGGQGQVARVVQAIDCFTELMQKVPPEHPVTKGGGGGQGGMNPEQWTQVLQGFCQSCLEPGLAEPLMRIVRALTGAYYPKANEIDGQPAPAPPLVVIAESLRDLLAVVGPSLNALVPGAGIVAAEIANCICPALRSIAESQATQAEYADVPQSVIDALAKRGALSADVAQAVSGAPWATAFAGLLGSLAGFVTGDDPSTFPALLRMTIGGLEPIGKAIMAVVAKDASPLVEAVKPYAQQWAPKVSALVTETLAALGTIESDAPKAVFNFLRAAFTNGAAITAENVEDGAFRVMGIAWLVGQGIHLLGALAGYLGYPMSSVWGHNAALMVDLLAFDEIKSALHGSFWPALIGNRAKQKFDSDYRTVIPGYATAYQGLARGKITPDEADALAALNGVDSGYADLLTKLAYRPVSPFILAAGFTDQDVPEGPLRDSIINNGYAPADVDMTVNVVKIRSLQSVRQALVNAAIGAAGKGALTDAQLGSYLKQAQWGQTAIDLTNQRLAVMKLEAIASAVEEEAIGELTAGNITADEARSLMSAAGVADWRINLTVGIGQTKAAIRFEKLAEAEARRELQAEKTNLTKVALSRYQRGELDTAALTAALELIWSNPAMVAALVSLAQLKQAGSARYVYGALRTPEQAALLKERVAALHTAVTRGDMTYQAAEQELLALGVSSGDAAALADQWAEASYGKGSQPLGAGQPTFS